MAPVEQFEQYQHQCQGSDVAIKTGDIFQQPGLKAIAFNEYFDTLVDNKVIGDTSLNGVFIQKHLGVPTSELDRYIEDMPLTTEKS